MHDDYSLAQLLDPHGEPVVLRAQDVAILLGCGTKSYEIQRIPSTAHRGKDLCRSEKGSVELVGKA